MNKKCNNYSGTTESCNSKIISKTGFTLQFNNFSIDFTLSEGLCQVRVTDEDGDTFREAQYLDSKETKDLSNALISLVASQVRQKEEN